MHEISLGHKDHRRRQDVFADGDLVVNSPKGVRATERALLNALPQGRKGRALVIDSSEGLAGLALKALNPDLDVHAHFDDAWDLAVASEAAERHPNLPVSLAVAADPPEGPWDMLLLPTSKDDERDLLLERLEFALASLKPGGLLFASTSNRRDRALRDYVVKLFGSATTVPGPTRTSGVACVARRRKDAKVRQRNRERAFTVLEGERELAFVTRPGVFCHGKLDEGTRALLAALDLGEPRSVLDLGCGAGVLGAVAALRAPEARVTLVDSNARALDCARRNLDALGLAERCAFVLTADAAHDLQGSFDLIVTNPPYYGNYRVSEMFLDTTARCLEANGRLVLVTKDAEWHAEQMERLIGPVETVTRGGYAVLLATRRPDGKEQ
jgi:16S rRNA (guanine1207-N2)-methyltransferase